MKRYLLELTYDADESEDVFAATEDLAWDAAVAAAQAEGLEIGSDDFVRAFNHLKARYAECGQAYGHLKFMSAMVLRQLMNCGMAVVYPKDACTCEEHMAAHFDLLAQTIFAQFATFYGVGPMGWYSNEDWNKLDENQRTIFFEVVRPDNDQEEDKDANHD